jgi:uncharacterized protein
MRAYRLAITIALMARLVAALSPTAAAQTYQCREVKIPMRDGVNLAADVYVPTQGNGPFPVIVERTPYNKNDCKYDDARYYAARGYVVVIEDERGRYQSEGDYYWWRDHGWGEHRDGYDTIEWAATQSWSNGKVGTMGLSMGCHNQYMTAPTRPPHLEAMFCADAAGNPYKDLFYQGGALHMIMPTWLLTEHEMARPFRLNVGRGGGYVGTTRSWSDWYASKVAHGSPFDRSLISDMLKDMIAHPNYDEYWRQWAIDEHLSEIDVPIFHYAAWYDRYPLTQVKLFNGIREHGGPRARASQRIQLGPWTHGAGDVTDRVIGDLDFGASAVIDYFALRLRWFDHYLKGVDNGIDKEPPVRIFVMGANVWRAESEFPLARTTYTDFFLRAGRSGSIDSLNDGILSNEPAGEKEAPDSFAYDPRKPVPTIGGDFFIEPNGARDHRPADRLSLTYTTPSLERDVEVTGIPKVELFGSSTAVDTDWVVTIADVHPNGYAQILRQNLLRARFRGGYEHPSLMEPNTPYTFTIEMFPISNLFKQGHRIRLTVSSSSFPKWYPNDNTGRNIDDNAAPIVATNTLYHDSEHRSRAILPIIPAARTAHEAARSERDQPRR